eukprot:6634827-Pyramimonas_sp.AAC.1
MTARPGGVDKTTRDEKLALGKGSSRDRRDRPLPMLLPIPGSLATDLPPKSVATDLECHLVATDRDRHKSGFQ